MAQYGHNETNVENCMFIQQLLRVGTVAGSHFFTIVIMCCSIF